MKKILYSIVAFGSLLVWAACSENGSPISGSTEIPNMGKDGRNEDVPHVCASRLHEEVIGDSVFSMYVVFTCIDPNGENILNPHDVPDSCVIEDKFHVHLNDGIEYSDEYKSKLDSMSKNESLDSATRVCAQKYSKISKLIELEYTHDPLYQSYIVKSIRCESGNVYTTNGFKQYVQELDIENEDDSLAIYAAVENLYSRQIDAVFNACVDAFGTKKNVIWDASSANPKTLKDSVRGSSIALYGFDSAYGGEPHFDWTIDKNLFSGSAVFTLKDMEDIPNMTLGIWFDGKNSKTGHKTFDVNEKGGVCFLHYAVGTVKVMLDMGDSLNAIAGDNLYEAVLTPLDPNKPQCVPWRNFKQHGRDGKIDFSTALKHVAGFRYKFTNGPNWPDPIETLIEKVYYMEK